MLKTAHVASDMVNLRKMSIQKFIFILACLFLTSCQKERAVDFKVISNGNLVDVETGEILQGHDIWIDKDRIVKICPHDEGLISRDTLIDASNKFIIPSLWDMHAHMLGHDWVRDLYTALGVTGLRIMNGTPDEMEDIKKKRKDGFYKGFELLYSSPITDGPGEAWAESRIAGNPDEGRQLVREYYEKGYDFVKVYNFLSLDTYLAIADECKQLNFPFAGHVPMDVTTEEAVEAGQKSIEHTIGLDSAIPDPKSFQKAHKDSDYNEYAKAFLHAYDSSLKAKVLNITKSKASWFCPTLMLAKSYIISREIDSIFKHDPRLRYIPKEEQDYWFGDVKEAGIPSYLAANENWAETERAVFELRMSYLKDMLDNGTRFLAGTDNGNPNIYPGFSLHDELELFVKAGFTELEALQTATLNPAIFAERENELGTLEEGKIANLLMLDNNPLENIKHSSAIYGLIRRGEYLGKDKLQALLNNLTSSGNEDL